MLDLSVVVPLYNERENIVPLVEHIASALAGYRYEIILVDDGSTDGTAEAVMALTDPSVVWVELRRNYGQSSAMAAGIRVASAPVIALMDGDLQNDASDIPAMMGQLLAEDLDMVAGRRMARQDHVLWRKFPSKIANRLIGWLTGVKLNDYGCSLKVFRASLAKELDLYGELHRFIPVLVSMRGGRFAQVPVRHHRRHAGSSKYGIDRTFRVISDLLLMIFFQRFLQRPMHLFGYMGLGLLGAGGLIEGYLLLLKLLGHSIGGRPLFYVGWMAILGGFQCLTTGLVAELVMRTYFASHQRFPYEWRRVMVRDAESWRSRMDS